MRPVALSLLALCSIAHAQTAAPAPITLHVGDPAPKLTIVKWLKGTPQTDLADGKVRVVEFWATWCGPCKVGMPHLSELQKRYGAKVAFVGVDASERTDDVAKAQAFVDGAHDMMAYNVAYATPKAAMTRDWMKAAGQNGIPCAFVVDKHGRIGWIGHPLMGLQEALGLAVQDKLDPAAASAIDKAWDAKVAKGQEDHKALQAAMKEGRTEDALRLNDAVGEELPYLAPGTATTRYTLLAAKDPAAAKAYGATILVERANAPILLQSVAGAIVKGDAKGAPDYALAKALVQKSLDSSPADYASTGLLARVAFGQGDKAEAVRLQQKALEMIPAEDAYARVRAAAEKVLAEYQGA